MKPTNMRAAVLRHPAPVRDRPLTIGTVPVEEPGKGSALLKVLACGVCRTDLHIVEGELPQRLEAVIPGHQIVAEVVSSPDSAFVPGQRVGVSWIGGVDGTCRFCRSDRENLCDAPTYTGYSHNGGYAEFTTARTDFLLPLPEKLSATEAAPLLCAGIIGFRSMRVAEVKPGMRVGLFGFGSSAQLLMRVLRPGTVRLMFLRAKSGTSPLRATWERYGSAMRSQSLRRSWTLRSPLPRRATW